MSNKTTDNIKLGLFVTIAVALFTMAVYYLGNRQHMFGSTITISSVFNNVKGLKVGNTVRYAGISVGSIDDLVLLNDSMIRVDMNITKEIQQFVKQNAIARIATNGLVGDVIISISPGTGVAPSVTDGDIIQSYAGADTDDMLNALSSTTDHITVLAENLIEITESINHGQGSVAALLHNGEMATDLQMAIKNLRNTSKYVEQLSDQFSQNIDHMSSGEGLLGYLLTDTTFQDQITMIVDDLDTLVNYQVTPIMDNLEATTEHILIASTELDAIVSEIDLNSGVAGVLLRDTSTAQDITQMLQNLNEGTHRFNESMEALKHNFLLRGYFKKQEKKRRKELERQQKELEKQRKESEKQQRASEKATGLNQSGDNVALKNSN